MSEIVNLDVFQRMTDSSRRAVDILPAILRKVRAVALHRGVAPQDVDDMVHEAFVRVESYARRHEIRSREAYMVTATVNMVRDRARHRARAPVREEGFDIQRLVDAGSQPEEKLLMHERLRRLASGLRRLDEQTRRCLLAKRLDGLTAKQIAKRENLSTAAVEKRVARAILYLTQWMGEL